MAGKPTMEVTHFYRHMRKAGDKNPVTRRMPQVKDEEGAWKILNDIIRYEDARNEWLGLVKNQKWSNPKIDSLLNIKKRNAYESKLLVRYML